MFLTGGIAWSDDGFWGRSARLFAGQYEWGEARLWAEIDSTRDSCPFGSEEGQIKAVSRVGLCWMPAVNFRLRSVHTNWLPGAPWVCLKNDLTAFYCAHSHYILWSDTDTGVLPFSSIARFDSLTVLDRLFDAGLRWSPGYYRLTRRMKTMGVGEEQPTGWIPRSNHD